MDFWYGVLVGVVVTVVVPLVLWIVLPSFWAWVVRLRGKL